MQKVTKYTIFNTRWGCFGLAATAHPAICRTHLPAPSPEKIKTALLKNLPNPEYDKNLFKTLQQQIIAYFDGCIIDFSPDIPAALDGFSRFALSVLTACRDVEFGQTITYGRLAKKVGRPNAARAVGRIMAKNPMPLIIPCHRVIRTDGGLGGFSAPGGITLKKRLLSHEKR
ncbi:MAG: methylated-DNA--[protein]-cysteine S-methyltransferase [Planctomycetota bacterium]|jgi:methylated-DNA-[protein]-cysteine S-methyltransferase